MAIVTQKQESYAHASEYYSDDQFMIDCEFLDIAPRLNSDHFLKSSGRRMAMIESARREIRTLGILRQYALVDIRDEIPCSLEQEGAPGRSKRLLRALQEVGYVSILRDASVLGIAGDIDKLVVGLREKFNITSHPRWMRDANGMLVCTGVYVRDGAK